ncbi:hypothetical protein AYO44_03060 [Planctomycetaceae bacterium SCGC AG-212-F19]|nr:hypothetical protein AYO44_03060 [Planctomycetaceae bacterium SCGC AG-212-F19]
MLSDRTRKRLDELQKHLGKASLDEVLEEVIAHYDRFRTPGELAVFARLTPRLREVLRMIGEGNSTKQIAYQLQVTTKTVEFHRARLMKRLEIRDVAALVRFAVRVGAVAP